MMCFYQLLLYTRGHALPQVAASCMLLNACEKLKLFFQEEILIMYLNVVEF